MMARNKGKRKLLELGYGCSSSDGAGGSASSSMPSGVQQIHEDSQMVNSERDRGREEMDFKFWSTNMDPKVWGHLPNSLALEIYKRLPMQSYYRLREVCKDWNVVARERRCVTDPIHKPYFVLILQGECESYFHDADDETDDGQIVQDISDDLDENSGFFIYNFDCFLHGMLTFHIESGGWRWQKLHAIPVGQKLLHIPFSVNGLTFSCVFLKRRQTYQVFDAHTRKTYRIPQQPVLTKMSRALGMTVDTSVVPYSFKIIVGSLDIGTQIYDSVTKSWETRSSLLVPCEKPEFKSCLHCGSSLYIWSQVDKILVYSLETDKWSTLDPPSFEQFGNMQVLNRDNKQHAGLGTWDGRIFAVTSNGDLNILLRRCNLHVWELVDEQEQKNWKFVSEMPFDMHRLLKCRDLQVVCSFCEEFVMIYSWVRGEKRAGEYVLYNLASKEWERVKTPNLPVSIHSDDESELDNKSWDEWNKWDESDESDEWEWDERDRPRRVRR